MRRLVRIRSQRRGAYRAELERLARKLRGFVSVDELDAKVDRLANPTYPDAAVWGMVWGIDATERDVNGRERAPRCPGPDFRRVVDSYDVEVDGELIRKERWVDERIESAAQHIAAGLGMRAPADGRGKSDGATERKQISRLRRLVAEDPSAARWEDEAA